MKRHQSPLLHPGVTLIELSVVMVVLFSLVFLTFIGASAWQRGTDRSDAILLMRSAQIGLRSYLNIEGKVTETIIPSLPAEIFGQDKFVCNGNDGSSGSPKMDGELPDHPVNGLNFGFVVDNGETVPKRGELYICTGGGANLNDLTYNPTQDVYAAW